MQEKETSLQPPRLLDQVRHQIRIRHYSLRTEQTYVHWIRRFILFHNKRHPREMGAPEVEAFLSHLALERKVAANTQNLALSALLFLYKKVLEVELPWLGDVTRAKRPQRLPTVLSRREVEALLKHVSGTPGLVIRLLYGTGMRISEALRLRVKDLDLEQRQVMVRNGKGGKDRITVLPESLLEELRAQLAVRRTTYDKDARKNAHDVWLPDALERKYPNAGREWGWQYVFVARVFSPDPRTGVIRRHHVDDKPILRAVKRASPSRFRRTPCATASQPTCSRPATTSARCRSCWATRT